MLGFSFIVGHLVGDYLLQNGTMYKLKKVDTREGTIMCAVHSAIWTVSVVGFGLLYCNTIITSFVDLIMKMLLLFASHFMIDRSHFVRHYCERLEIDTIADWQLDIVDNTIHLLTIYILFALPS